MFWEKLRQPGQPEFNILFQIDYCPYNMTKGSCSLEFVARRNLFSLPTPNLFISMGGTKNGAKILYVINSPQLSFSFTNKLRREAEIRELNICKMAVLNDSWRFEWIISAAFRFSETEVTLLVLLLFFIIFSVSSELPKISTYSFYSREGKKLKNLSSNQYMLHISLEILEGHLQHENSVYLGVIGVTGSF